jgi:hypothetical protein
VGQRTSCKDQVHAVLAKAGVPVSHSDIFGRGGGMWLDALVLPQPYAGKLASLPMAASAQVSREENLPSGISPCRGPSHALPHLVMFHEPGRDPYSRFGSPGICRGNSLVRGGPRTVLPRETQKERRIADS